MSSLSNIPVRDRRRHRASLAETGPSPTGVTTWVPALIPSLLRLLFLSVFLISFSLLSAMPVAWAAVGGSTLPSSSSQPATGRQLLQTFVSQGNRVTVDGGPLRRLLDDVKAEYLAIPNDDLLKGFRARAGLPAPGNDLGGWYSGDVFHVFGQIVSGLSRLHAVTGDPACREKAEALLAEWARCIEPDGYFYYSRKPNAPHYIYDKTLWGLLDARVYLHSPSALDHASRITDWAIKNLERSRKLGDTSTEWYTLSENLYRAWMLTGDPKYRDFAAVWEYKDYWGLYRRNESIFAPRPDTDEARGQRATTATAAAYHAYSHVNTLGGAGAVYLATGDTAAYLAPLKNAYESLQDQTFATGGFGPDEQLLPRNDWLEKLRTTPNSFETQCGSWAVFKLTKYLITCTGDARYGDWAERLYVNGIAASLPMAPDGRVFYYSDYRPDGGVKRLHNDPWTCCTGTRPQAVAECADLIYFHDASNVFVNLFVPSTLRCALGSDEIRIQQQTRFPENGAVALTISTPKPLRFGLRVRKPSWAGDGINLHVNSEPIPMRLVENHWLVIDRKWRNNDTVAVDFPMRLEPVPATPTNPYPVAVRFGPTTLAFRASSPTFATNLSLAKLDSDLTRCVGEPLTWRLRRAPEVLARPFAAYGEGQEYYVYLDPQAGRIISHRRVLFTGRWNDSGRFRFSNEIGASAECVFEGAGVRWLGFRYDDAGRAEVQIDGTQVGIVDQFGPGRDLKFEWSYRGLAPGKHTLRLRLLGQKDPASKDHYLNVAGFELLDP